MVEEESVSETKELSNEGSEPKAPAHVDVQQPYYQYPPYGAPQAYPQPYGQQPSQPPQDMMSSIFWKSLWFLVLIGGILILVGQIMLDVAEYDDEGLIKAGRILRTISAFMIGVPMVITGVYYDRVGDIVRFGLILSGVLLLAFAFF